MLKREKQKQEFKEMKFENSWPYKQCTNMCFSNTLDYFTINYSRLELQLQRKKKKRRKKTNGNKSSRKKLKRKLYIVYYIYNFNLVIK